MKVHGQRIYLNMPELPESKLELSPEMKKELKQEMATKFERLTVFAVADSVTFIKVGDEVLVDPLVLKKSPIINIDGKEKLVVSSFDIMHTW